VTVSLFPDIREALRTLRREPLLVVTATLTLALSIGANSALFGIANAILLRPLPYPNSSRIDWISERSGPSHDEIGTAPDYYRIREWNRVFEEVAAFNPMTVNWTGIERPQQLDAAAVSPSFFRLMGMPPLMGRFLAPDEEGSKAAPVVILSYSLWRNRLGSDAHIIGETITLDRLPRTVIGVMPQGFDFPRGARLWLPWPLDESSERPILASRPIFTVSILARRRPRRTAQEVDADLNRLASLIRPEYKVFPTRFRWDLTITSSPLQQHLTGKVRPALVVLSGAAGLVLLIACVNLANLLLARAGNRRREVALRLALGAGRGRIVRQVLTESLALAAPGGLAGIALAWLAVHVLNTVKPAILVRYPPISLDWLVLAFTAGLTLTAAILFGAAPALSAAGISIREALQCGAQTHTRGFAAARFRKSLIVAELGVSLVLLIAAGLLARTFVKLAHTALGFRSDHLLTFRVNPIGPFGQDYTRFYAEILDRLQQLPQTQSAALLSDVPLSDEDFYSSGRVRAASHPQVPFLERPMINNTVVSPQFFRTLGIPLKSGRIFDERDAVRQAGAVVTNYGMISAAPVVVNEAFVRRIFPGENPLGRQVIFGPDRNSATWTIIGVVGDIRGGALGADPPAMVYRCVCDGSRLRRAAFAIRTTGDPEQVVRAVEEQVHAADRDVPIFDVKIMEERRAAAQAPERFQLLVIASFAAIALVLAAIGVYGVVSYLVTHRTREIGIRMAMGARPADVLSMVMRETMLLVLLAASLGLAGAWGLTRYIRFMLYGITELDPATFLLAPALLLVILLAASLSPARNAASIDPVRALRDQ
jgi:predicted permease